MGALGHTILKVLTEWLLGPAEEPQDVIESTPCHESREFAAYEEWARSQGLEIA